MAGANTLAVFILALVSLLLTLNYFFSIARMYRGIRHRYIEKEKELKSRAEEHVSIALFNLYPVEIKLKED